MAYMWGGEKTIQLVYISYSTPPFTWEPYIIGWDLKKKKNELLHQMNLFKSYLTMKRVEMGSVECTYGNHFALGGHVGGSVGEAQFGLQRVEVGLQFGLLFDTRRLVFATVLTVFVQLLLHTHQRVVRLSRLQPRKSLADPFQQLIAKNGINDDSFLITYTTIISY